MSEISLPHDESERTSIASPSPDASIPLLGPNASMSDTFWYSFVFSSTFEKFCIRRWKLLLLVYYALQIPIYIGMDLDNGFRGHGSVIYYFASQAEFIKSQTYINIIADVGYNVFVIGTFLSLGFYYSWQKGIPEFFQELARKLNFTHIQPGHADVYADYERSLLVYKWSLVRGKRRILTRKFVTWLCLLIAMVVSTLWWIVINISSLRSLVSNGDLWMAVLKGLNDFELYSVYTLLFVYLTINCTWVLASTGLYLRHITKRFSPIIQPGHPDNCGGLKFLGDFCLNMALIILSVALFLAIYILWRGYVLWTVASCALLIIFLIQAYYAFFTPLWSIHKKMLEVRARYEEAFARSMAKVEEKAHAALNEGSMEGIKTAKEDSELVQALHPDKIGYPNWPFNRREVIAFATPQIVPLFSLIVGLSPPISNALQNVLSVIRGG